MGIHPEYSEDLAKIIIKNKKHVREEENFFLVKIKKTQFKTSKTILKLGKYSDLDELKKPEVIQMIERAREKKKKVFRERNEDTVKSRLHHPVENHLISSEFWTKRLKYRYERKGKEKIKSKIKNSIHKGLDFAGKTGTTIYAMADGKVVIAEKMYFEGNYTLIDHGLGFFSGYMHQNEIFVEEGDKVIAGEKIGSIGETGAVTGAHLHVFIYIRGIFVDPMSLLVLPVRD
ncbi:MAG: M23 family metallopeptidase [Spirochaetia bacterium]|nr:M23 family metallopeptidase [Spirochaetia bacterium]